MNLGADGVSGAVEDYWAVTLADDEVVDRLVDFPAANLLAGVEGVLHLANADVAGVAHDVKISRCLSLGVPMTPVQVMS